MAKIEDIERRLRNWARWRLTQGAGPLGYAAVRPDGNEAGVRTPYEDAPIPTNGIEASETEDAVRRLPSELKRAVEVYYVEGRSERDMLRRLCVTKSTMHARIDQAHRALQEHFTARLDKARQERRRVEALQASVLR